MSDDPLRRALHELLGPRPSAAKRRRLAEQLRALADEQERLAGAEARQQTKPPALRVSGIRSQVSGEETPAPGTRYPAPDTRKGGRPSSMWVKIERRTRRIGEADELRVKLSRKLYYEAGRPERLDVQRIGGELLLIPSRGDAGYAVVANQGGVWINASGARDIIAESDGRYAAAVQAGRIVVGERL